MSKWITEQLKMRWLRTATAIMFICFMLDSIMSAIVGSMMNVEWSELTPTAKFLCVCIVIKSAAVSTIAFLTTAQKRIEKDESPFGSGDTAIITKTDTTKP
jgi:uncharacterized membrane protein YidH (DUF202 family)